MYDLRKLEIFCKVCELRSFSKAGEMLFISQPTVSAHIQALEQEVNARLFDRMPRSVIPTQAGEILLSHVQKAFGCLKKAQEEIGNLFSDISGDIQLGSTTIPAHYILPQMLTLFLTKHPKVRPNLIIDDSKNILQQVQNGTIYAGIVSACTHPDSYLHFTPLLQDDIMLIAPPTIDSMLEDIGAEPITSTISLQTVLQLPWVMHSADSTTRTIFEDCLRQKNIDPHDLNIRLTVDNSQSVVQYVSAGLGISIASRLSISGSPRNRRLRALTLEGIAPHRMFSSVIHTKRALFPATSLFLDFLRTQTQALQEELL